LPVPTWVEVDADGLVAALGPGATWLGRIVAMRQVPFAARPLFFGEPSRPGDRRASTRQEPCR